MRRNYTRHSIRISVGTVPQKVLLERNTFLETLKREAERRGLPFTAYLRFLIERGWNSQQEVQQ